MSERKRKLTVNCGLACLLNDRQGSLDNYDHVTINSGTVIISSEVNSKLSAKGGTINSGDLLIRDIKGEILQLDDGAVIDGNAMLKGFFVIAKDNLLVKKDGMKALEELEGLIALGTVYYPISLNLPSLIKVSGKKQPYPDDAQVFLGDHTLESLGAMLKSDKHIWISGRLEALDRKAFENIKAQGYTISCGKLLTFQGLNEEFGGIINCPQRTLVPDGYEIIRKIHDGELALYGEKLYVDGNFAMNEDDIPALEELEAIIVKGKASLPARAVKIFRSKGKAEDYFIFEGRLIVINGFEQFSHSRLEASAMKGEKLSFQVNGCLLFDEDVSPEDIECIASLSYNGSVLISGAASSALARKVKTGNGFMGDASQLEAMTGKNIKDLFGHQTPEDSVNSTINLGVYILA